MNNLNPGDQNQESSECTILVLGASGYVGSRLVPLLLQKGFKVRAAARSLESLRRRPWFGHPCVESVAVDILNEESLDRACAGSAAAYYLVHSMNSRKNNFVNADRRAAQNMIAAAQKADLERIIYLGGLGDVHSDLSKHLRSRAEVSQILHSGKVPVTTFRAAMIIGTGSVSFEILGYLVRRLPVMITPAWVETESQPIAIRNVLKYLIECLEAEQTKGEIYDIGGLDVIIYRDLMDIYAEEAELPPRFIIPVPILTPILSSYWIDLVTPVPASVARPLAEGLRNRMVCQNHRIRKIISQELVSCRQAIRMALNLAPQSDLELGELKFPPPELEYAGDPRWTRKNNH